jgi:hypothetical protein
LIPISVVDVREAEPLVLEAIRSGFIDTIVETVGRVVGA